MLGALMLGAFNGHDTDGLLTYSESIYLGYVYTLKVGLQDCVWLRMHPDNLAVTYAESIVSPYLPPQI